MGAGHSDADMAIRCAELRAADLPLNYNSWLTLQDSLMPKKPLIEQPSASFEDAMAELEQLVARMESGELPLEASLTAYQRGSELVKFCAAQLERVDKQVKVLQGEMLKPFDDGADQGADEDDNE